MINLCLVVIATQFSETKQREHALMKSEQRARQLHQSASTLASDSQPGSCYEEIIRYLAHLGRKACRRLSRFYAQTHTHFHCVCMCQKDRSGGAARGAGVGEMNGLAHRHSGHAPNDLSHLHQLYHRHHQHHHQHQQLQAEPAVSNGGNGFNYPFIVPLLSHLDEKGQDPKKPVATETISRLPQLVVEHGENEEVYIFVSVSTAKVTVCHPGPYRGGGFYLEVFGFELPVFQQQKVCVCESNEETLLYLFQFFL